MIQHTKVVFTIFLIHISFEKALVLQICRFFSPTSKCFILCHVFWQAVKKQEEAIRIYAIGEREMGTAEERDRVLAKETIIASHTKGYIRKKANKNILKINKNQIMSVKDE